MCGIVGLYPFNPSAPSVDRAELRAIRDHMTARGPDGHGEWFSDNGRVAFGHRRLAIIDLSERAAQPMHSADGQLVITFNGEIYNYRELRKSLEAQGHVFRSNSDTEVLLHLYQAKGTAMMQDLRGMFAFALWDARKQALLLARDPFGIKPLYYTPETRAKSGTLRFASQVKALLAGYNANPVGPMLLVGYNRRFSPPIKRAIEILRERTTPLIVNYRMNAGFIPSSHWVQKSEGGGRNVTGNHAAYLSSADRGGQYRSSIPLEQSDVEAS